MDALAAANGRAATTDIDAGAAIGRLDKAIDDTEASIADATRRLQAGLQGIGITGAAADRLGPIVRTLDENGNWHAVAQHYWPAVAEAARFSFNHPGRIRTAVARHRPSPARFARTLSRPSAGEGCPCGAAPSPLPRLGARGPG